MLIGFDFGINKPKRDDTRICRIIRRNDEVTRKYVDVKFHPQPFSRSGIIEQKNIHPSKRASLVKRFQSDIDRKKWTRTVFPEHRLAVHFSSGAELYECLHICAETCNPKLYGFSVESCADAARKKRSWKLEIVRFPAVLHNELRVLSQSIRPLGSPETRSGLPAYISPR